MLRDKLCIRGKNDEICEVYKRIRNYLVNRIIIEEKGHFEEKSCSGLSIRLKL